MHNKSFIHSSFNKWVNLERKLLVILLLALMMISLSQSVVPSYPIVVSPNTESSPSNFIFNFALEKQLDSSGYLLISFTPFASGIIVTPKSCLAIGTNVTTLTITSCQNLNTGSNAGTLTINSTWLNQINPNIIPIQTIAVQFNQNLSPNFQYSIQIITNNIIPAIGSITSDFEMYAISGTGFMLEENWNYGQVYFEYRQNNILNVNSVNDLTQNYPGTLTSNLLFEITISIPCPTPISVIKFIISGDFSFSPSSLVNVQGVLSTAPVVISTTIISPNIIVTKFGESFASGRKFRVSITEIANPMSISTGFVSVYYLPENTMSPLEIKELAIPIATKSYNAPVQILTGEGISSFSPVQFYQQKQQYLTIIVTMPRQFNSNFVIQVYADTLTIQPSSVYAVSNTALTPKLLYNHYLSNGVQISGFPTMATGTMITITMKIYIPATSAYNIQVSIDQLTSISNPIIQGNAPTVNTVVPTDFIFSLTGTQGEPNKLTSMASATSSPYSSITFLVTPTSIATGNGASLQIFTCENLIAAPSFNPSGSCLVGGVAKSCTILTNSSITLITINSGSSSNFFPNSTSTSVTINDLQFLYLSSNTEYIYQFYFQLTLSQVSGSGIVKTVWTPQVIPQRPANSGVNTGFPNYFSNDLYNSGPNYPNIFRIVSIDPSKWNYIIQANEKRMITVFQKQGWRKMFTTLKSGDSYPFMSSIPGVTSTFILGTTNSVFSSLDFPLTWDQLHFILPGGQNTTTFSIAIPTTYTIDPTFHFQIMSGIYNIDTRSITYRAIEMMPVSGSRTYKDNSTSVPISTKPKQLTTKIQLAGKAGSYRNDVEMDIQPFSSGLFSGTTFSTSLIIFSTWNWFDSTTLIDTANISSPTLGYPSFTNDHQMPLSLQIGLNSYLTYIPFTRSGPNNSFFSVYFDSVKLPYSYDLPYYSIVLVDQTGTVDSYDEFINQNQGVFYPTVLLSLSFNCSDNSIGVTNTDCSLVFVPNQQIDISSKIYVTLTGIEVSTSMCMLTLNSYNTTIPNTCLSNKAKNELIVSLKNLQRLPESQTYTLKVYGMSILSNTINPFVNLTIRDNSGGYIIQMGTRILLTSVSTYFPIFIEQMTYLKNNPIVVSGFVIIFTLPRQLNQDENFAIVMGYDLSNLNFIPCKLKIRLYYNANNTQIPNVSWFLNMKNYQIIFEDLHPYLTSSQYRLQIYGLKTPSKIDQSVISLIYLRIFDNSYAVQNINSSTAIYPKLTSKVNSLITMRTYLNTEGVQQPLQFNITGQYAQVNSNTVWYVTLPRYYSQPIWNQNYLTYCTINNTKVDCARHQNIPYTIIIKNSPLVIDTYSWYLVSIYGITCPRAIYLNGNPTYATESIFFGMALNQTSPSYIQYSELFMTSNIINPQTYTNYGTITAKQVSSSNNQTYQTTYFTLTMISTVAMLPTDYLIVTFPEGFDNFNDLDMEGNIVMGGVKTPFVAKVINTKLTLQLPAGVSIPANNLFSLELLSLPTPKSPISIDMNKIVIVLAPSSMTTTKASSLQLHNQLQTLTFVTSELHLVVNNYQTIQLTAGTCVNHVPITASDNNVFLSNVMVQFVSNSLTFSPNPVSLYLNDYAGYFTVCAAQNLIPKLYTYEIIKRQSSISAFYTALQTYSVRVSNTPISINIPASLTLPKGGCSIPIKITVPKAPNSDMAINYEYDRNKYLIDQFWINEQVSYNELSYNSTITDRYMSFCCSSNFSYTNVPINLYITGTNLNAYILSTTNFTITIISNITTIPLPSLSIQITDIQKSYAQLQLTANIAGLLYYELDLSPLNNPIDLTQLKYEIKQKNNTLQKQRDFIEKWIYLNDRDHRIDLVTLNAGSNYLSFSNLLPQRSYTFCAYYENQHRNDTQQLCTNFTTQTWGPIMKSYLKFKYTLQPSQLNNILCYFTKTSNSNIRQIVTLQGQSCSLNNSATNYYFNYIGQLSSNELAAVVIYHVSSESETNDPSGTAYSGMFGNNELTNASLNIALSGFSIDYISSSYSMESFDPIGSINLANDNFKPTVTFSVDPWQSGSTNLTIRNIQLSKPGSVYFILTPYKKITQDQIAGHTDIKIRPLIYPTAQQILNCLDGYNVTALSCQRVVLKGDDSMDLQFTEIEQNRMYATFYIVADQYPLRPIVYGSVQRLQLPTFVLSQTYILPSLLILLLLTLLFH